MASAVRRALKALRPRFAHEVEIVVAPTYARQDELTRAVDEIRRIIADHLDAASEEAAVFGRLLAELRAETQELRDAVEQLTAELHESRAGDRTG